MGVLRRPRDLEMEPEVGPDCVVAGLDRARESASSASRIVARFAAVRRCAARPAASVSTPMRSSSMAITSRSVASWSGADAEDARNRRGR